MFSAKGDGTVDDHKQGDTHLVCKSEAHEAQIEVVIGQPALVSFKESIFLHTVVDWNGSSMTVCSTSADVVDNHSNEVISWADKASNVRINEDVVLHSAFVGNHFNEC